MTGEVLSAGLLDASEAKHAGVRAHSQRATAEGAWDPELFAREQIRGMVRRVFFSTPERPVRQVVLSATEARTDVQTVCKMLGDALALETHARVAVVGALPTVAGEALRSEPEVREGKSRLKSVASRTRGNLWLVPGPDRNTLSASGLHQYLSQVRAEFEFSIVATRATDWFEAIAMSQFADGIVLVLSAQHTRRMSARRMKEALEGSRARLLGTVLADRLFPMPEAIYRRL